MTVDELIAKSVEAVAKSGTFIEPNRSYFMRISEVYAQLAQAKALESRG